MHVALEIQQVSSCLLRMVQITRPKYVKRASILDQIGSSRLSPEERNKKRAGVRKKAIEKMAQNETRRAMFASSAKSGLTGNYFIVG
eukprot:g14658.t1